jgi:hypothetical protein
MLLLGFIIPNIFISPTRAEIVCGPNEAPVVFTTTDVLFIIDSFPSMCPYSSAVAEGMANFVTQLTESGIDAHYAVASFGGPPKVLQKFSVSYPSYTSLARLSNDSKHG